MDAFSVLGLRAVWQAAKVARDEATTPRAAEGALPGGGGHVSDCMLQDVHFAGIVRIHVLGLGGPWCSDAASTVQRKTYDTTCSTNDLAVVQTRCCV